MLDGVGDRNVSEYVPTGFYKVGPRFIFISILHHVHVVSSPDITSLILTYQLKSRTKNKL